eukprot:SAG25_NODE_737_length_5642_cov_2.285225_6_plen_178_part_00
MQEATSTRPGQDGWVGAETADKIGSAMGFSTLVQDFGQPRVATSNKKVCRPSLAGSSRNGGASLRTHSGQGGAHQLGDVMLARRHTLSGTSGAHRQVPLPQPRKGSRVCGDSRGRLQRRHLFLDQEMPARHRGRVRGVECRAHRTSGKCRRLQLPAPSRQADCACRQPTPRLFEPAH